MLIWSVLVNRRMNHLWNMQKRCGIRRYKAINSTTSTYWRLFLLKAYRSRSATVWGSTWARRRDVQCSIWCVMRLHWRNYNRVAQCRQERNTDKPENQRKIVDAKVETLITWDQVDLCILHHSRVLRLEHQLPWWLSRYGINSSSTHQIYILHRCQWGQSPMHPFADYVFFKLP